MQSFESNLFVVTFLVCLSVKHGLSIKCYDCNTTLLSGTAENACRDKFGNSLTRECQSSVCSIVVKTQDNGKGSITRGCGSYSNGTVIGAEVTSADHGQYFDDGALVFWNICTTDLCNWDVTHKHRIRRQIEGMLHSRPSPFGRSEIHRDKRDIKCYVCSSSLYDVVDKCAKGTNMVIATCPYGACRIFKVSFGGEDMIERVCDGPDVDEFISVVPEGKDAENDKLTRLGIDLSWSTCTTDLCNWGVMNKYQMVTLFVGVMMSLSVYYTMF